MRVVKRKDVRRIASSIFAVSTGQLVSAAAVLVGVRIQTTLLSPQDYGLASLLIGAASIGSAVLAWPIGQSILVTYAKHSSAGRERSFAEAVARLEQRISLVGGGALTAVGLLLAAMGGSSLAAGALVGPLFALEAKRYLTTAALTAASRARSASLVMAADNWSRVLVGGLVVIAFDGGALGLLVGTAIGSALVGVVMKSLRARPEPTYEAGDVQSIAQEITERSRPLLPSAAFANVSEQGTRYVVAATAGLADAGVFAAALGIVRRPFGMLNSVVDLTFKPLLARADAEGDQRRSRAILFLWLALGLLTSVGLAAACAALSDQIVALLLGPEFASASGLLPGVLLGMVFLNAAVIVSGIALVKGDSRTTLASTAVSAVASVLASFVFVRRSGIEGAPVAVVLANVFYLVSAIGFGIAAVRGRRR